MAPSDFAKANIDEIVEQLTTDEAVLLIAGVGFWHTHAVERLGIPAIKARLSIPLFDGPNGIRGNHFFMGTPAKCLPSATALGATFDTELIEIIGLKLLAGEAKLRGAAVALAPTCNIQRSPLGGRSFESFSEDPHLSGMIAAAYVKGVQSGGIATTIKHFVGNDKENDRMGYDSIMSDRALREVYLMPFMLAQKYAQPWSFMTAYNRVNGTHVSENPLIIQNILRDEWKFEGMVMSDWFGVYSIDHSINAGLDLEMPGTNKWRTLDLVKRSIGSRKITLRTVKARARKVLEFVQKCCKHCPEVLDGDGHERTVETDGDKLLMRQVAAESIILLKNEERLLPLRPKEQGLKKIAIVGGNAKARILSGGGSAALKPSYFISPYEGIVNALEKEFGSEVEVSYCEGARAYMTMPTLEQELFTEDGKPGWIGSWYSHLDDTSMTPSEKPLSSFPVDETRIFISTSYPKELTLRWTLKLKGFLRPRKVDTPFEFGLMVAGRAKLFVDRQLVIDNWTRQRRGDSFFNSGTKEERGIFTLKANTKHEVLVEFCNVRGPADGDEDEVIMDSNPAVQLGGDTVEDFDKLMDQAVTVAEDADAVIAIVGLNADWETEGYDRTTLALPGRTDELISKIAAVNKKTVVVTQSGSAITMPWTDEVPSMLHAWYLGNATGDAIADVLFGKHNPSGKLSMTFPKSLEDVPSHGHFHSENGKVRYAEDLFVGYKHYHHRKIVPQFPFGHGLSYTTFSLSALKLSAPSINDAECDFTATFIVTNTGAISGSEVIQIYLTLPSTPEYTHPALQLRAFSKIKGLQPGEAREVVTPLDKYALSYWDDKINSWVVTKGVYGVQVGVSSENIMLQGTVELKKEFEWNGL
ncbi:beta-glucosidase [Lentinula aciculospora]|uniref:beta-glucosidase n=1 Tax=Lentinula aciculospora TaxID=153920 RepID=A0A9W9DKX6_9AGAR|nr:beta-glucosidase [Lentinula aciculospora]